MTSDDPMDGVDGANDGENPMMFLYLAACGSSVEPPPAPAVDCAGDVVWTPTGRIDEAQAEVCQA